MYRQEILMFDIHNYSPEIVHHLRPYLDEYRIDEKSLEYVFDFCMAYSINRFLEVNFHGYVFNLHFNDVYRNIYYEVYQHIDQVTMEIFDRYKVIFKRSEVLKLLVTYNTIVMVRSFNV